METSRSKLLDDLAALATFSRSTTLQWIVPVAAVGPALVAADRTSETDSTEPPSAHDLELHPGGNWVWTEVTGDDLTDGQLDPSLSRLFGHRRDGVPETSDPTPQRIRRYFLKSRREVPVSHGHFPMFDISGSGRSVDPQVCDVRLVLTGAPATAANGGETQPVGPEGYLTILLRVPARNLPPFGNEHEGSNGEPGSAWTVSDVLQLNWALVGRAALRTVENERQRVWGNKSYKAWRVHTVDGADPDDPEAGIPWLDYVRLMLGLPIEGCPWAFDLDLHQIPTSLASVVLPGAKRNEALLVAQQLGELLQNFDEANMPNEHDPARPDPVDADKRLMERSHGIIQYVTQRCSGLVICAPPVTHPGDHHDEDPDSPGPSSGKYRRWVLAGEMWKYWNYALFLVLHERRQLGRVLDELSDLEIPVRTSGTPLEQRQRELDAAVARLSTAEQAFYQLQASFRYRVISRKYGLQNYYEHCYAELRLEALYNDVEQILTGIDRVVQRQMESVSNELEEERNRIAREDAERETRFERAVSAGGVLFGLTAVVLGVLSINIRNWTSGTEGLALDTVLKIVAVTLFAGAAITWGVLRIVRKRAERRTALAALRASSPH